MSSHDTLNTQENRLPEEAILSAAGAWVDDELSLRDRNLVVVAALITQSGAEQQSYEPIPAGQSNMAALGSSLRHSRRSSASMPATHAPRTG